MDLAALKNQRLRYHSVIDRLVNTIDTHLQDREAAEANRRTILADLQILQKKAETLTDLDARIMHMMEQQTLGEDEYATEMELTIQYERKVIVVSDMVRDMFHTASATETQSVTSGNFVSHNNRKFTLPKIHFHQFGGEIKDWLRFWGQFQKIHDDNDIAPEDKHEYLLQATTPGSRARVIVESFPRSKENYYKAVDSLKSRFGRDDLLVESYQRELLKLVVYNILNKGQVPLTSIYDQLETHIRSLESLGVTTDKSAGLLYPLVESCISDDLLRVWQRASEYRQVTVMDQKLDRLMTFLRNEVEGEEKIALAGSGLGLDEELKNKVTLYNSPELATTSSLVTHSQKPQDRKTNEEEEVSVTNNSITEPSSTNLPDHSLTTLGRLKVPELTSNTSIAYSMSVTSFTSVSKSWDLNVLGIESPAETLSRKTEPELVHDHFLKTVRVNTEGRYEIHLPCIPDHPPLPSYWRPSEWATFVGNRVRETRNLSSINQTKFQDIWYAHQFSEYDKTVWMIGWMRRFFNNSFHKKRIVKTSKFVDGTYWKGSMRQPIIKTTKTTLQKKTFLNVKNRNKLIKTKLRTQLEQEQEVAG
ncbi:Hypothetical protein NTJ_12361 [Nesidiocoris tenuis]|uniref:Uncharacterized protein n=1 Tax=Nesidiocoris tenuis TaxID=355587 RepID=A0ABN7B6R3_9HEMI|nr:Hypothetical protein NTJ_12361 [Nesidiocoris tenuis]